MPTPEPTPSQKHLDRLVQAVLPHIPFDGWTDKALTAGLADLEWDESDLAFAAPGGILDVLNGYFDAIESDLAQAISDLDLKSMRVRDRVRASVELWFDLLEPHKAAVRAALARSASRPLEAPDAPARAWSVADTIWTGIGDTSEDFNYYSKRTLLSAVIGSTVLAWLGSDDVADRNAFLARRIENVMTFEKLKATVLARRSRAS